MSHGNRTIIVGDDAAIVRLLEGARERILVLAPALSNQVAKVLGRR
jgi:hypothetical protein